MSGFKKATKTAARLRLALIGPPGSGKTYTGIGLACCLGKKVAVIDTERGSASKYADVFAFDVLELAGSFHPKRYVEAIHEAAKAGYDALVIDSLSHAWIGKDGGLDLHDQAVAAQKTKNSFTAWAAVTPHHMALVDAMIQCPMHVIVTMRSKVEYAQDKDGSGKPQVRKIGTAPLMRDGVEYEFDVVGDMDTDNRLTVTKTRCPALAGKSILQPDHQLADTLKEWLGGEPATASPPQKTEPAPEKPAESAAQSPAKAAAKKAPDNLPKNGKELAERLDGFDQRLAAERRITRGALVGHVTAAMVNTGHPDGLAKINDQRAILAAVDVARAFAEAHKGPLPDDARPAGAAAPAFKAGKMVVGRGQRVTQEQVAILEEWCNNRDESFEAVANGYLRKDGTRKETLAELTNEEWIDAVEKMKNYQPAGAGAGAGK